MRVRGANEAPFVRTGEYVLYWMTAYRRAGWNHALARAAELARSFERPLLVLEALRCDYPHASDRLHAFVLQGMAENRAAFRRLGIAYYPYVEPELGAGKGLLAALAARACAVVSDDYPAFFIPRMAAAAAARLACRMELVDSNGLLPMRAAPRAFTRAVDFRRFLQRELKERFALAIEPPLASLAAPDLPAAILRRWPAAREDVSLSTLSIDHSVAPVPTPGGTRAARERLARFLERGLERYGEERSDPAADATSRLSPYLHFGHLSVQEVFAALAEREGWTRARLGSGARGAREGWWGMSPGAEAFLDQLVTWRELGFNFCAHRPHDYQHYESLPAWARQTLAEHAGDPRPHRYSLAKLEAAATHDAVWNAAQRQLVREGWFHGYLRMLWGKKILEWSARPQEALAAMSALMDKYSLDGRDPNSWAGYFWVLGRYDRPWPKRPVLGAVRSMSSRRLAGRFSDVP